MSDLERLNEALENASCWMAMDYGDQHNDPNCDVYVIDSAARAYADLLADGKWVWWCETHGSPFNEHEGACIEWLAVPDELYCDSVFRLLINPPTEEE